MADIGFTIALAGGSQMNAEIDKIRGHVDKSAKEIQTGLGGMANGLKDALKNAIPFITGQFAVQGITALAGALGGFVHAADEAAVVNARLVQALKVTAGASGQTEASIEALSQSLAKTTLFEDDDIKAASVRLLQFKKISGETFTRVQTDATDLATVMGTDLVNATQLLAMAVSAPGEALRGIEKATGKFTDAEREMLQALVDTGKGAEATDIILKRLEGSIKGQAETVANSGAGQWKQFKKELGEVGEQIGGYIIPVLAFLGRALKPLAPLIIPVVAGVAALTVATIAYNNASLAMVGRIIAGIIPAMTGFALAAWAAVAPLVAMVAPVLAIGAAITALGYGVYKAIEYFGSLGESAEEAAVGIAKGERLLKTMNEQIAEFNKAVAEIELREGLQTIRDQGKAARENLKAQYEALIAGKASIADAEKLLEFNKSIVRTHKERNVLDIHGNKVADDTVKKAKENVEIIQAYLDKLNGVEKKAKEIEKIGAAGSLFELDKQLKGINERLEVVDPQSTLFFQLNAQALQVEAQIKRVRANMDEFRKAAGELDNFTVIGVEKADVSVLPEQAISRNELNAMTELTDATVKQADAMQKVAEQAQRIRDAFNELGNAVRENVAMAFGDLAFNMGQAIAMGEDLGLVIKNFIASLIEQVGKMIGFALIGMALPPTPFPASLGFLAAGLAVLGLSGLLSGALRGKNKGMEDVPGSSQAQAVQPGNAPGLSSFNESTFQPMLNIDGPVTVQIDGQDFRAFMRSEAERNRKRRGN